jgi:O-antigen/teichoic acid export membrane protein
LIIKLLKNILQKKLTKDFLIYGFGSMMVSMSSFLLLPIYIRSMSIEEYGLLSIVLVIPIFLNPLISLSLEGTVIRFYYEWKKKNILKKSIFSIWVFMLTWGALISFILLLPFKNILQSFVQSVDYNPFLILIIIITYLNITYNFVGKILRAKEDPKSFVFISVFSTVLKLLLIIFFVSYMKLESLGALYGILISDTIMFFICLVILLKNIEPSFYFPSFKEVLLFVLPSLPGLILINFGVILDRFILDKFFNQTEIGIYSLSIKIASLSLIILTVVQMVIIPYYVKIHERSDGTNKINLINKLAVNIFFVISIFTVLFVPELGLLLGKEMDSGIFQIIALLASAYFFQILLFIPNIQFYLSKKLIYTTYSVVFQISSFLLLSFFMVPNYGLNGLAFSLLISNILLLSINSYFGNNVYPLKNSKVVFFSILNIIFLILVLMYSKNIVEISFNSFVIKSILIGFCIFLFIKKLTKSFLLKHV